MNMKKIGAIGAALMVMTSAHALTHEETQDAGTTMATAHILAEGVTAIHGSLGFFGDTDLYAFAVPQAALVHFTMGESWFDDNLLLFNANGKGLGASDDQGGGLDSRISIFLTPGVYYIGAGMNNMAAFDDVEELFDNDWGDVNGVLYSVINKPMTHIGPEFGAVDENAHYSSYASYTVSFSFASGPVTAVPEPSSHALIGAGLFTVGALVRRRRSFR